MVSFLTRAISVSSVLIYKICSCHNIAEILLRMALNTNQSINLFHQDMLLDLMKYVPPTKLHCYVKVAPLLEGHTFCPPLIRPHLLSPSYKATPSVPLL